MPQTYLAQPKSLFALRSTCPPPPPPDKNWALKSDPMHTQVDRPAGLHLWSVHWSAGYNDHTADSETPTVWWTGMGQKHAKVHSKTVDKRCYCLHTSSDATLNHLVPQHSTTEDWGGGGGGAAGLGDIHGHIHVTLRVCSHCGHGHFTTTVIQMHLFFLSFNTPL